MQKNKFGMREITEEDAEKLGIDLSMTDLCRMLRRLAKLGRLRFDHMEDMDELSCYIEYCGGTLAAYIKDCLSNLQPYMIEQKEQETSCICVLDRMYRIFVWIENGTAGQELAVSCQKDYGSSSMKQNTDRLVPVFSDSCGSIDRQTGNVSLKLMAQRGLMVLPLNVIGFKYKDMFIVREADMENQFISYCNQYIRDLYGSSLHLDFDNIEVFSVLQQISFTTYGRDTFSSVSLLIDALAIQHDWVSKQAADFALVTFVQSLRLAEEQKEELVSLLEEKYMECGNNILFRVKSALRNSRL